MARQDPPEVVGVLGQHGDGVHLHEDVALVVALEPVQSALLRRVRQVVAREQNSL